MMMVIVGLLLFGGTVSAEAAAGDELAKALAHGLLQPSFGMGADSEGDIVRFVVLGSPAWRAGIRPGATIVRLAERTDGSAWVVFRPVASRSRRVPWSLLDRLRGELLRKEEIPCFRRAAHRLDGAAERVSQSPLLRDIGTEVSGGQVSLQFSGGMFFPPAVSKVVEKLTRRAVEVEMFFALTFLELGTALSAECPLQVQ